MAFRIVRELIGNRWVTKAESESDGGSSFNGGTILLEVSTELVLDNTGTPYWSFVAPLIQTSDDVTLNEDEQTLDVNEDGWYQIWYSFAHKASATTVKAQLQSLVDILPFDVDNFIQQGSLGEIQPHLDGAVSLLDQVVPFTSLPLHIPAGGTVRFRAAAAYTAGSVGDAILSTNTYVAVVRLA